MTILNKEWHKDYLQGLVNYAKEASPSDGTVVLYREEAQNIIDTIDDLHRQVREEIRVVSNHDSRVVASREIVSDEVAEALREIPVCNEHKGAVAVIAQLRHSVRVSDTGTRHYYCFQFFGRLLRFISERDLNKRPIAIEAAEDFAISHKFIIIKWLDDIEETST